MATLNRKNIIFSGSFSMRARDEVTFALPGSDRPSFRLVTVEDIPDDRTGVEFEHNTLTLEIPVVDIGQKAREIEPIHTKGVEDLSARILLQGFGEFTLVTIEIYEYTRPF